MIKRRGLIKLLAAALVFAAGDLWIYNSLLGSFRSYYETNSMKEVTLFARTAPGDASFYQDWLAKLPEEIEGGRAMIFSLDADFKLVPAAADPL
ncbi:MAG: iron ABC transporter permease, partial [Spirochaetaceae bacterium]|nr:iron ABC transporter permease [Spirochaetaceae bacterium]